jgi:ubiquinone/menaquinone biosynthesis C-methylase UbiE
MSTVEIDNLNHCIVCNSTQSQFLFEAKDRLHNIEGIFTYVRCKTCGLVYLKPWMTTEQLAKFYPTDYVPHQVKKKAVSNRQLPKFIKTARNFFFDHQNIEKIPRDILNSLKQDSKVLDIGCGNGTFLNDVKQKMGCQIYGVDIADSAIKSAKENYQLEIIKGTPEEKLPLPKNHFDLITIWWSLVHLSEPHRALQQVATLLKEEGHCIIGVPNFNSFNARLFKNKWAHLDAPRHLCIYTPTTIRKILERHGLSIKKIIYDRNPSGLFSSLQYYYYERYDAPKKIDTASLLAKILFVFAALTAVFRISDLLIVHAQKKPILK